MSIVNILGESAVRSLALALAVWLVLRLLRIQHARIAKRAWTAVLVLALAMPALVALHIPSFSFTALWAKPQIVIQTIAATTPPAPGVPSGARSSVAIQQPASPSDLAPTVALRVPVPAALQGPPAPIRHIRVWQMGFAAYLAITALLLLRILLGLALATRLWHRAQPFATSETNLPVRLSVDLRSPATIGRGILLPLEAVGWDDTTLRATLAHEVQHIREGDFYLQLAATLHHSFFWISPHAWWLRPQLSRLSETICDRAAVATGGDGLSYAQLLIRFATAEQAPAGMVAMAQSAGLRERIDRLIADPELTDAFRKRRGQAVAAAALFAIAAVVAAASVHIIRPQTVVLAAPQAPAPPLPSVTQSAPADVPALPPLPSADISPVTADMAPVTADMAPVTADSIGIGVGEGASISQSQDTIVYAQPEVHLKVKALPDPRPQVYVAAPQLDVSPVVTLGAMSMVQPHVMVDPHVRVYAAPRIVLQADGNDVLELDGRNYTVCGADNNSAVQNCSLNGYTLKDHKGGAILFERDGKIYVIDDPALVKEAHDAFARVTELGRQQGELGAQQGKLGSQQGELGALQGQLGAMQGQLGAMEGRFYNGPELHFDMPADFDQAVQNLTDSTTRLALEEKLSDADRARLEAEQREARERFDKAMADWKAQQPQREAMEKQIRDQAEQIRKQMEPLMQKIHELSMKQSDLGRLQGELGRQQALLGMQQRDASRQASSKMQSLIDRAMKDGKARPVQ